MSLVNVVLSVVAYIQQALYTPLNVPRPDAFAELLPLDRAIPFVPAFIVPYLSMYLLVGLTYLLHVVRRDQHRLSVFLLAAVLLWSVSNYVYGTWPTVNVIRPAVTGGGPLEELVRRTYAALAPYNTFPSGHNASAALAAVAVWRLRSRLAVLWIPWAAAVCLSTLLVRQHYLLDVAGSAPLAIACYLLCEAALGRRA